MAFGLPSFSTLLDVARRLDRVFENVEKAQKGLEKLNERLDTLEERVLRLESREEMLIVKAEAAATVGAQSAISRHLVSLAEKLGGLDVRTQHLENGQKRLKPPQA